ncbi:MAG: hypothetical protein E7265_10660 [Lachnospiraceae bacterium]|nr:hypothetical protein [Lachnospiraceae bacterium]
MTAWKKALEEDARNIINKLNGTDNLTEGELKEGIDFVMINELFCFIKEKYEDFIKTDIEDSEKQILQRIYELDFAR